MRRRGAEGTGVSSGDDADNGSRGSPLSGRVLQAAHLEGGVSLSFAVQAGL